ncbi:MAG: AsmA family protein [Gammaproteobacteria bacterium]|nr:AsmA family protein [Gammaproteobacteria bacterium]
MIWIKRLLLLFAAMLIGMFLLVAGMLAFFNEADYKRTAAWIASHFFDSELTIAGPVTLQLSDQLQLNISDIRMDAHDDRFHFSSKTLKAAIQLRPLLSGTLWLNELQVSQLFLRVNESTTTSPDSPDPGLLPVIVTRASIEDLVVEYQELPPGTLHRISLNELQLDDVADAGPISLRASGLFEDQPFEISGTLPAIDEMPDHDTPKPVELLLTSDHGQLHIAGTITDLMHGKGLELHLQMATRDTKRLLEWLGDGIPDVGDLQVTAQLRGDYDSPRLEEIDARLIRAGAVEISVLGSVDDLYSGDGLLLHVKGQSKQPDEVSWLLFGMSGQLSSLEFSGTVEEQGGRLSLSGVNATAASPQGLLVSAQGKALIYDGEHLFLKTDSGLDTTFSAPTTAALNLFNVADLPELGAVSGRLTLLISTDAVGVYDADVSVGKSRNTTTRLQGQIREIPLLEKTAATGIELKVSVQSADIAVLAERFGYRLPAIGPGSASMNVVGAAADLKLKQVNIQAGDHDRLLLTALGSIDKLELGRKVTVDRALFDVAASTPDLRQLSTLVDSDLPKLGPASLNGTMTLDKGELVFDALKVNIGRQDQPTIRLQGKATTQLQKGSTIRLNYNVAVADLVAAFANRIPDYLGRLEGNAEISDIDGSWGIEQFKLVSSQTRLYQVALDGGIDDLKNTDQVNINVNLDIMDPAGLGKALGLNLSRLKPYRERGVLTSNKDALVYNGKLSIGKTSGTTAIHGSRREDELITYKGTLSVPLLDLTDFGFRLEPEVADEVIAKPGTSDNDYLFSRKPLQLAFLNSFGLDLRIHIDEVENHGKSSIDSVVAHITLKDGDLKIAPLHFVYAGGTMDVIAGVQATTTPVYTLKVIADDLVLGPMMAQAVHSTPIDGRTNVDLDVSARGNSAHELAANLNGKINLELENARIPKVYADFLSVDMFGWVLSTAFAGNKYANLNCVVADFTADSGEIKSKLLLADGPDMSLGGRIDLDLREETIDAVLLPKQKRRLFSNISPIRLSGPIRKPRVLAIPAQAAIQEIGTLALSPTIYLSTRLMEKIWLAVSSGGQVGEGCTNIEKLTDEAEKAKKKKPAWQSPFTNDDLFD